MQMRKLLAILLAMACVTLCGCKSTPAENPEQGSSPVTQDPSGEALVDPVIREVVILYTSDVDGAYYPNTQTGEMGYAVLGGYAKQLEEDGKTVILVDGGNAVSNRTDGSLNNVSDIVKAIGLTGYRVCVPGEGELKSDPQEFVDSVKDSGRYVSCNLMLPDTKETALPPYQLVEIGEYALAFIGITSPAAGELVKEHYDVTDGAALYRRVQTAIDLARAEGADYVFAVGAIDTRSENGGITSTGIIANTHGLTGFLGGGNSGEIAGDRIIDSLNEEVVLTAVGTGMTCIARLQLQLVEGSVSVSLEKGMMSQDAQLTAYIADIRNAPDVLPVWDDAEIEE